MALASKDGTIHIDNESGVLTDLTDEIENIDISDSPVLDSTGGINASYEIMEEQGGATFSITGQVNLTSDAAKFFTTWRNPTYKGTQRDLELYPNGNTSGNLKLVGKAIVGGPLDWAIPKGQKQTMAINLHINNPVWSVIT